VREGLMSFEERMARPRVERSEAEAYMFPPLRLDQYVRRRMGGLCGLTD
jgi:hypothetical protein